MINHDAKTVSGKDYDDILAKLYPGRLDKFNHVSMSVLEADCIARGLHPASAATWDDQMMVYFLAQSAGLLSKGRTP